MNHFNLDELLLALLFFLILLLVTGGTIAVIDHNEAATDHNEATTDHNKKNYQHSDYVVHKMSGQIYYVRGVSESHQDSLGEVQPCAFLSEVKENDLYPYPVGKYSSYRLSSIEKLNLPKPAIKIGDRVKSKKNGLTGMVKSRHQGFEEWVYKVRLDKDFENYEKTEYNSFRDPRKYQEWDESDILLPVHQEKRS